MKKKIFQFFLVLLSTSIYSQTLTGIYTLQQIGGIGDDNKLSDKAKNIELYQYKYSNFKSSLQLLSKGGTSIDTLKRYNEQYNFDYETVETTSKPTKVYYFKNFKENIFERIYTINNNENFVKDNIPQLNWEITNEKKIIDGYECIKAKSSRNVFGHTLNFVAWFCDKIPVNDGPFDYHGLPGFILEINANGLFIIKFNQLEYKQNTTIDIQPAQSEEKPMTLKESENR